LAPEGNVREGAIIQVVRSHRKPPPGAVSEAAKTPEGGWVYAFDGPDDDFVPPERIRGGWKVDESGQIVGEFQKNPNYVPRWRRLAKGFRNRRKAILPPRP
jgi:hypothetical protein